MLTVKKMSKRAAITRTLCVEENLINGVCVGVKMCRSEWGWGATEPQTRLFSQGETGWGDVQLETKVRGHGGWKSVCKRGCRRDQRPVVRPATLCVAEERTAAEVKMLSCSLGVTRTERIEDRGYEHQGNRTSWMCGEKASEDRRMIWTCSEEGRPFCW